MVTKRRLHVATTLNDLPLRAAFGAFAFEGIVIKHLFMKIHGAAAP